MDKSYETLIESGVAAVRCSSAQWIEEWTRQEGDATVHYRRYLVKGALVSQTERTLRALYVSVPFAHTTPEGVMTFLKGVPDVSSLAGGAVDQKWYLSGKNLAWMLGEQILFVTPLENTLEYTLYQPLQALAVVYDAPWGASTAERMASRYCVPLAGTQVDAYPNIAFSDLEALLPAPFAMDMYSTEPSPEAPAPDTLETWADGNPLLVEGVFLEDAPQTQVVNGRKVVAYRFQIHNVWKGADLLPQADVITIRQNYANVDARGYDVVSYYYMHPQAGQPVLVSLTQEGDSYALRDASRQVAVWTLTEDWAYPRQWTVSPTPRQHLPLRVLKDSQYLREELEAAVGRNR